jgi:cytochrome bd-type quinol oxidase subunit 1
MTNADATASDAAWAALEQRWEEEAAHKELLAACSDLEALAEVGRRYRAVLERRPGDAMAQAAKAEILKRATVIGLSQLPRTRIPDVQAGPWPRRLILAGAAVVASILAWVLVALVRGLTS